MKQENQLSQTKKIPKQNKIRYWIIWYGDMVLRGLLSFFMIGILFEIILIWYLHFSFVFTLIIVFFTSILLTPLFSRIQLTEKLLIKYEKWLKKVFKLK